MTTATTYGVGTGYTKPTNEILLAGIPGQQAQTMHIETATGMYPGVLVMKGTNDNDIVVNTGEGTAIGWLGYEQTAPAYRPATVDTIYLVDAQAVVINGPGICLVASLVSGQTIVAGDMLVATSDGKVSKWSVGHTPVAVALQGCTSGSYDADLMVRSLI